VFHWYFFFKLLMYIFLFSLWLFCRYVDVNFKIGQGTIWWLWELTLVFSVVLFDATLIFLQSFTFTYNLILFVNFCYCRKFYSAPPPPLQAGTFSRGVVTMRCDISTSSSAHISLLVSGSADACFNDQVSVNCIVNVYLFTCLLV
jgi:hypothetical protein